MLTVQGSIAATENEMSKIFFYAGCRETVQNELYEVAASCRPEDRECGWKTTMLIARS